ncbi:MAG: CARDB domain-containing protein [Minisyncoccota bacterium]
MYRSASLVAALVLFPLFVSAADAGFPAQSIWLSTAKPVLGEKVRIYTVVHNGTASKAEGTVTFLVDGKANEAKSLSLDPGESSVVSSTWTAADGEHTFSARFSGKGTVESAAQVSAYITATVSAPPSAVEQTISQAKDVGTQIASTSLPIISTVANKVFATTEALRNAGIAYLEEKAPETADTDSTTESEEKHSPAILGTSTVSQVEGFKKDSAAAASATKGVFSTIKQTASVGALTIFRNMWLFYPIFVVILLLIFRWLYKWATRPRF